MQSTDYLHLREVFTELALQQSNSPDVRRRWLAVAQACFAWGRCGSPQQRYVIAVGWAGAAGTSEVLATCRPAGQDRGPNGSALTESEGMGIATALF